MGLIKESLDEKIDWEKIKKARIEPVGEVDEISSEAEKAYGKEEDLEEQFRIQQLAKQKEEIEDLQSYRKMRETYATRVHRFLVFYSITVACMVLMTASNCIPYVKFGELIKFPLGAGFYCRDFQLDTVVLSFLVSSTAVSAIGLVLAVTQGLFGKISHVRSE